MSKKLGANFIWVAIYQMISILAGFAVRSIIIRTVGTEYLGANSYFSSLMSTLNIVQAGISTALVCSMYEPFLKDDVPKINAILMLYKRTYTTLACLMLVVGLAFYPFIDQFVTGDIPDGLNLHYLYIVYLVSNVGSYLILAYKQTLFTVSNRLDVWYKVQSIYFIVLYGVQFTFLIGWHDYYAYVTVQPIFSILYNIVCFTVLSRMFPQLKAQGELDRAYYREFFKRLAGILLLKVRDICRGSFDTLTMTAILGLTVVGKYGCYTSVRIVGTWCASLVSGVATPALAHLFVDALGEERYDYFKLYATATCMILIMACSGFLCLCQSFMGLWVGADTMLGDEIALLFTLQIFVLGIADISGVIKNGQGIYWQNRFAPVIESVLLIALDLILVPRIGVAGVIIASVSSMLLISIPSDIYVIFKYCFRRSCTSYVCRILYTALIGVISCSGAYYACTFIPIGGIPGLFVIAMVSVVVTAPLVILGLWPLGSLRIVREIFCYVQRFLIKKEVSHE